MIPKVPFYFFSRDKFRGHSLTQICEKCFIFFRKSGKKIKQMFYFFPRKSLSATHSKFWRPLIFYLRKSCSTCFFFFPQKMCVIFFPRKSLTSLTHSSEKSVLFFFRPRKKNKTAFLLTHMIFVKNVRKTNLSREKK